MYYAHNCTSDARARLATSTTGARDSSTDTIVTRRGGFLST